MKRKIIYLIIGIIGLILIFFLGRIISASIYKTPASNEVTESNEEQELQPAQFAMTEEEIEVLLDRVKIDALDVEKNETDEVIKVEIEDEIIEENPIDFEALWEVNEDVYAWISIPGTEIDYPILQHPTDNMYYLNHNLDHSYGYPACIYTENFNSIDFTDSNTVIYGHNMGNGTMFAGLHAYESADFFRDNKEVIIYLPDRVLHYTIFAAYTYDDRHLMYSFDFSNEDIYRSYLESIFGMRDMYSNIDKEIKVSSDESIITLATCVSGVPDKRYLVQAVLQE